MTRMEEEIREMRSAVESPIWAAMCEALIGCSSIRRAVDRMSFPASCSGGFSVR